MADSLIDSMRPTSRGGTDGDGDRRTGPRSSASRAGAAGRRRCAQPRRPRGMLSAEPELCAALEASHRPAREDRPDAGRDRGGRAALLRCKRLGAPSRVHPDFARSRWRRGVRARGFRPGAVALVTAGWDPPWKRGVRCRTLRKPVDGRPRSMRSVRARRRGPEHRQRKHAGVCPPQCMFSAIPPDEKLSPGGGVEITGLRATRDIRLERRLQQERPAEQRELAISQTLAIVETELGNPDSRSTRRSCLLRFAAGASRPIRPPRSASETASQGSTLASSFGHGGRSDRPAATPTRGARRRRAGQRAGPADRGAECLARGRRRRRRRHRDTEGRDWRRGEVALEPDRHQHHPARRRRRRRHVRQRPAVGSRRQRVHPGPHLDGAERLRRAAQRRHRRDRRGYRRLDSAAC